MYQTLKSCDKKNVRKTTVSSSNHIYMYWLTKHIGEELSHDRKKNVARQKFKVQLILFTGCLVAYQAEVTVGLW